MRFLVYQVEWGMYNSDVRLSVKHVGDRIQISGIENVIVRNKRYQFGCGELNHSVEIADHPDVLVERLYVIRGSLNEETTLGVPSSDALSLMTRRNDAKVCEMTLPIASRGAPPFKRGVPDGDLRGCHHLT